MPPPGKHFNAFFFLTENLNLIIACETYTLQNKLSAVLAVFTHAPSNTILAFIL